MIINDDKEGMKRKIEQLETELKCVEELNLERLERIVQLSTDNIKLMDIIDGLRGMICGISKKN